MALSELLHAWELLKKGGSGGILVGLGVGLWLEKFPAMPVLYGLSQWKWSVVAVQGQRITYQVPDVLTDPNKLQQHNLDLLPLLICGLVFFGIGIYIAEVSAQRRA